MNMFKSRRKAKDASEVIETPSQVQSAASIHRAVKGLRRKNKNLPTDAKPKFDLASALPTTDDFRTSLLMPNLSARFSMLREQDDPKSKIGKASDDSVLFPKRKSRMVLFNHKTLAEVPEDDFAYSTFRPPFADRDRSHSFGDGYDSDGGSVMGRSRPGEINSNFGERQKLYGIPTSSARNLTNHNTAVSHWPMQEHDIAASHDTPKESEASIPAQDDRTSTLVTDMGENSVIASPATAFSQNRGTQSSTNSIPRRSSTAATSLASETQALRDSATEHVAHAPENNTSVVIPKQRDDSQPARFYSPSKAKRPSPVFQATPLPNASSPLTMPIAPGLDFGFNTESRSTSAGGRYRTESPQYARIGETEEVLANNVQPNDRGKATALGLFNRPAQDFDVDQFNQRQLHMYEHNVSSMSNSRSASRTSNDTQRTRQNSIPVARSPSPVLNESLTSPEIPVVSRVSNHLLPNGLKSKTSERIITSRPRSKSLTSSSAARSMNARPESLIRKQNTEANLFANAKVERDEAAENKENSALAFFDNEEDDEESDYEDFGGLNRKSTSSDIIDESHIHPAFRNSYRLSEVLSRKSNHSSLSKPKSIVEDDRNSSRLQIPTIETEAAKQQSPVGLGGLIRTHLRQNSDKSSIMLRPDSLMPAFNAEPTRVVSVASTFQTIAESIRSDLSENDTTNASRNRRISEAPLTPTTVMSQIAQHFLLQATAIKQAAEQEAAEKSLDVTPEQKPRQADLEPKHQRGGSSETTKERREFDEDLAQRRRKIREGLKSVTERDRSQSPANFAKSPTLTQSRILTDPHTKAFRMPRLRNSQSGPSEEERGRGRGTTSRGASRNRGPESLFDNSQIAALAQFGPPPNIDPSQSHRSATPPMNRSGMRNRSNSLAAERSKSRSRYREAELPPPGTRGYIPNFSQPTRHAPQEQCNQVDNGIGKREELRSRKSPPPDHLLEPTSAVPAYSSAMSPPKTYESPVEVTKASAGQTTSGRTAPSNGRVAITGNFNRKRSVTKTMISEPTFVSSTSSVPLVHLPTAQAQATFAPPLPLMNPRRRGNTHGEKERPILNVMGMVFSRSTPLESVPASPVVTDFGLRSANSPSPRKLRKATSEGGDLAAMARQQACAIDIAQQQTNIPAIPLFPSRSAAVLTTKGEGSMF